MNIANEILQKVREALEQIKSRVCGDRHPHWKDHIATGGSRMIVADIVADIADYALTALDAAMQKEKNP